LLRQIDLPKPLPRTIYAVFTKRRNADSFELSPRSSTTFIKGRLRGNPYIMQGMRAMIAEMYAAGFRFVHIEY
jgi:hypothetical protein